MRLLRGQFSKSDGKGYCLRNGEEGVDVVYSSYDRYGKGIRESFTTHPLGCRVLCHPCKQWTPLLTFQCTL